MAAKSSDKSTSESSDSSNSSSDESDAEPQAKIKRQEHVEKISSEEGPKIVMSLIWKVLDPKIAFSRMEMARGAETTQLAENETGRILRTTEKETGEILRTIENESGGILHTTEKETERVHTIKNGRTGMLWPTIDNENGIDHDLMKDQQ